MPDAVIVSAVRTAVGRGKADGSLAGVHPVDLSALVIQEAVKRANLDPDDIDDVLWGCAMPEGAQGLNVARLAGVDPELGLRAAADRFRERVEGADRLAREAGLEFASLSLEEQDGWYRRAKARG